MNRMEPLRKEKNLTMKDAAFQLGIPYTTYVNYEKGLREPNSEMLIQIANFFGVSIDYLLKRTDSVNEDVTRGNGNEITNMRNQEIKAFFDDVLNDVPSSFRVRFATVLARLSSDQWQLIADMENKLVEECKEENSHDE